MGATKIPTASRMVLEARRGRVTAERLLSIAESADRLGINYETFRRWIVKGIVKRVKRVGPRLLRVPESEVERLSRDTQMTT